MKWLPILILSVVSVNQSLTANASLYRFSGSCKSSCGECGSLSNCEPVICRPMNTTVFNYQRKYSNACGGCADAGASLVTDGSCCDRSCCAPTGCGPCAESTCCAPSSNSMPCGTICDASCNAPSACGSEGCASSCSCGNSCHGAEACKVIAQLIHQSMVGCYATQRRRAIHRLGDHFDCCCHPEIMTAFIYALNDSDERVRAKAADEIGDQVNRNRCICGPPVIRALRCALADCDRNVRREAASSLKSCGFKIVDGKCSGACGDGYCPASYGATIETTGDAAWSRPLQTVPGETVDDPTAHTVESIESAGEPPAIPAPAEAPEPVDFVQPKLAASAPVEGISLVPEENSNRDLRSFFRTRLPRILKTSTQDDF